LKKLNDEEAAAAADAAGRKRRKKDDPPLTPSSQHSQQQQQQQSTTDPPNNTNGGVGSHPSLHTTTKTGSGGMPDPHSPQQQLSPSLKDQLEVGDSSILRQLSKRRGSVTPHAQQRLQSQEQALMEQEEKEQTTLLLQQQEKHQQQLQLQKQQQQQQHLGQDGDAITTLVPNQSPSRRNSQTSSTSQQQSECDPHIEDRAAAIQEGNRHMGATAASHLEQLATALLETDAPLLARGASGGGVGDGTKGNAMPTPEEVARLRSKWVNKLMSLATRCCATVDPNIKRGDKLDIRPYVKIKGKRVSGLKDTPYTTPVLTVSYSCQRSC
jgi:hypothetical protein